MAEERNVDEYIISEEEKENLGESADIIKNGIKWQNEIDIYRKFKTMFILEGNVNDFQINIEDGNMYLSNMDYYLYNHFHSIGYKCVVFFNHIDGFFVPFQDGKEDIKILKQIVKEKEEETAELTQNNKAQYSKFGEAVSTVRKALRNKQYPVVIIMNMASRYITTPTRIQENEQYFFSEVLLASRTRQKVNSLNNLLFLVCDKANDLPSWLYIGNSNAKTLLIPKPDKNIRRAYIEYYFDDIYQNVTSEDEIKQLKKRFVDYTEGLTLTEVDNVHKLMADPKNPIKDVEAATTLYKYGIKDNPWNDKELLNRLPNIKEDLRKRVKGQDRCINQCVDIITRSILGMSGLQHSASKAKPKGIMFLAGPTGTGKTELAKSLAEWLFGTEDACIRFDMSEFQQSQSDQRLLGAPPGYIGYEEGGQLTNAVKEHPFSILLFDEIEKAHSSILDKFLQILEDGRMTDGKGETVYFSDCLIVFTSNLGIYEKNKLTGESKLVVKNPETPEEKAQYNYDEFRSKIMKGIRGYFTNDLGRPEILNRIGENFIIFEYINEEAGRMIAESQIKKIVNNLNKQQNIKLSISNKVIETLMDEIKKNLEFGGRGVGNVIEKNLINPLARVVCDEKINKQVDLKTLTINNIEIKDEFTDLIYEVNV